MRCPLQGPNEASAVSDPWVGAHCHQSCHHSQRGSAAGSWKLNIEGGATAYCFQRGHRIRLQVTPPARPEPWHVAPSRGMQTSPLTHCFTAERKSAGYSSRSCNTLQICSGAHPRWLRNLGTGEPIATARQMRVAQQQVRLAGKLCVLLLSLRFMLD